MKIRFAALDDAAALSEIYAQYISLPISFEYVAPSPDEFRRRMAGIGAFYPYPVCELDGRIAGYAYAHCYHERAAYAWDAELSVYVDKNHASRGIGRVLSAIVTDVPAWQGVVNLYSAVTGENVKSKNMHLKTGFRSVGVFRNVGFKGGKWHDIEYFEKQIGAYAAPPRKCPPVSFKKSFQKTLTELPPVDVFRLCEIHGINQAVVAHGVKIFQARFFLKAVGLIEFLRRNVQIASRRF